MPALLSRISAASPWILAVLFAAACGAPAETEGDAGTSTPDASDPDGETSADAAPADGSPTPDAGTDPPPDAAPEPEPDAGPEPDPDAGPEPDPDAGPGDPTPDAGPGDPPDGGPGDPPPAELVAQAGGETAAVALAGGRAYVGVGPRLTIWEVTHSNPVLLGETEPLSGVVASITVDGDQVFVTSTGHGDGALHVIDASDATRPVELASLRLGTGTYSQPVDVALASSTLFIADREQGLFRVDVTDATAPVVTASQPVFGAIQVEPAGDRVHVLEWSFFGLNVEAFSAATLDLIGGDLIEGADAGLLTDDGLLVTRIGAGLAVDDLTAPAAPVRLFEAPSVTPWAMIPADHGVWLTVDNHLRFLDLSNTTAISLGPVYPPVATSVATGALEGNTLALLTYQGGVEVLNISAANAPTIRGHAHTGTRAAATASAGAGLVAIESTAGNVSVLATTTVDDLALVGEDLQFSTDFVDVATVGDRAFVADTYSGLWAYDLADVTNPIATAQLSTGGSATALAASQDRVYVADLTNGGALRVFTAAAQPAQLGAIATNPISDLDATNGFVYAAAGIGGLLIYDARDPSAIELVGHHTACTTAKAVAVRGPLAALACASGVYVVDVTDPTAPTTLGFWQPASPLFAGRALAFDGTRLLYGHEHGVTVLDISNPAAPTVLTALATAWPVRHLHVPRPGRVIASATRAGLYQWQL